jgi:hypothetical protein
MISQELLDYIRTQKQSGISNDAIRHALLESGWDQSDVDTALGSLNQQGSTPNQAASVPPATLSYDEARESVQKMGKFKASWRLFQQSLNLLRQDKEVMLFPVISSIAIFIVTVLFGFGLFLLYPLLGFDESTTSLSQDVALYSVIFLYYIFAFFITTFFKVGLTAVVYERINGGNLSFSSGINRASGIAGKIFLWSVIASTVGIILQIISNKSKWLGKLVAGLLGAAWNIVTLFIAPTLLLEDVSVWKSIGRSAKVFKQTWGETLIINISFGLITFAVVLLDIVVFGLLAYGLFMAGLGVTGLILAGIPFVLSLVIITVISNSLNEIFKVALYSYARFGIIADGFSPELIVGAVKSDAKTKSAT